MVALDEQGSPRDCTPLAEPRRKISSSIVVASRPVDPPCIGPDAEIPDLQDAVEANPDDRLEYEHVLVEAIQGSVDIPCRADEHRQCSLALLSSHNVDPIDTFRQYQGGYFGAARSFTSNSSPTKAILRSP